MLVTFQGMGAKESAASLKNETVFSSKMLVPTLQPTQRHNQKISQHESESKFTVPAWFM
jgi:hypothetical protein